MKAIYSVVIPAFNAEKTIDACLASVIAQTLAPLEVIVVDDQSNDGTALAVQRCVAKFLAVGIKLECIRLAQNAGPSSARNKGMRMAKGAYIAFLDADDTWHREKLAIVSRFTSDSSVGLVYHDYTEASIFSAATNAELYQAEYLSIFRLLLRNPAQSSCVVVRNQHAIAFDETMRYCEDYDFWMRIAEKFTILRLVGSPLTRLSRPQLSIGGLSGNKGRMRVGEARVYYNFCKRALRFRIWLLPCLLMFSLLKHCYSLLRIWWGLAYNRFMRSS